MKTLATITVISSLLLFSISNTFAQNFQYAKKKYALVKGNNHRIKHQVSTVHLSKDSLHTFTDSELIKLANYIKTLEKGNQIIRKTDTENSIAKNDVRSNVEKNYFTDSEIIKLVYYIQYLETSDFTGSITGIKE